MSEPSACGTQAEGESNGERVGHLRAARYGALTRSHRAEARAEFRRARRRMAERVGFETPSHFKTRLISKTGLNKSNRFNRIRRCWNKTGLSELALLASNRARWKPCVVSTALAHVSPPLEGTAMDAM